MTLSMVTPATSDLISIGEARHQCRVTDPADDPDFPQLILGAREWAQEFTDRQIVTQTWDYFLDKFPDTVELPLAPVQSVTSIQYIDTAGALQTFGAANYEADLVSIFPRIRPVSAWPSTKDTYNAVTIRFVAGYTATHPDLHLFRSALLLHVEAHFDRDEKHFQALMNAAEALLWPLRRWAKSG